MATGAKWSSSVVESLSGEAQALFEEFRAQLEPRLAAGLIDGLKADTAAFLGKRVEAGNALESLKTATKEQNAAIAHVLALLRPARAAVKASTREKEKTSAFGISKEIQDTVVKSVIGAAHAFLQGAEKHPELARAAGVLSGDLDTLRALAASLASADQAQEKTKGARKIPTANRTAFQRRIEGAIASISHAGQLAFAAKPEIAARFKALIPGSPRTARKKLPTG
ncbi:MAG: hypothetical protein ACO1OB_13725 [Archangium sp.]